MAKVALFGCGNFGKLHREALEDLGHEVYVVDKLNAPGPLAADFRIRAP